MVTLSELVTSLENVLNRKAILNTLPEQQGDVPVTCADITKAKKLLNYDPKTKLENGLIEFVKWVTKD